MIIHIEVVHISETTSISINTLSAYGITLLCTVYHIVYINICIYTREAGPYGGYDDMMRIKKEERGIGPVSPVALLLLLLLLLLWVLSPEGSYKSE